MATLKKGILGPLTGSVANVTGYERLGTAVLRSKGNPGKQNFTPKQKEHQLRIRLANSFINPSKKFVNTGFSLSTTGGQTAHNVGMAHAIRKGVKGEYPDLELDFKNLMVSDGLLNPAMNPQVETLDQYHLRFSWDFDRVEEFDNSRDQVMLLAYSSETKRAFYLLGGITRSSREATLELYAELEQEAFETYISFITEDRKSISKSIYTGQVIMPLPIPPNPQPAAEKLKIEQEA